MELFGPLLVYLDHVGVVLRIFRAESLLVGMLYEGCEIVWIRGVHNVKEELPIWKVGLGALFREELGQLLFLHHVPDEAHDAELVILRYNYWTHLGLGIRCFRPAKISLKKSLVIFF